VASISAKINRAISREGGRDQQQGLRDDAASDTFSAASTLVQGNGECLQLEQDGEMVVV
jgi:hypothetical protein